ncbi:hypothetical protein DSO57_1013804 [Entomophthora muscae]|uniref:Uncharacterized protein n=1 Tax=Entomophthora muscae TaxID=34485 RepID=A0ACC2RWZ1_9FUNG|nr:hypothetical protein DSO57_1013804 [Entomophthora muscae]
MMGYYIQFIPDFSNTSKPLVQLLRNVPFGLTASQQQVCVTLKQKLKEAPILVYPYVATKFPDSPANVSYNTQGALNELSLDVSNNMNQSDGNIEWQVLHPNLEFYQFDLLIPVQVIPQLQTLHETSHYATPLWPCGFPHMVY